MCRLCHIRPLSALADGTSDSPQAGLRLTSSLLLSVPSTNPTGTDERVTSNRSEAESVTSAGVTVVAVAGTAVFVMTPSLLNLSALLIIVSMASAAVAAAVAVLGRRNRLLFSVSTGSKDVEHQPASEDKQASEDVEHQPASEDKHVARPSHDSDVVPMISPLKVPVELPVQSPAAVPLALAAGRLPSRGSMCVM
jgi:hypothetical protein